MAANPYDPVTTTDITQLADDDWGLTLPPLRYKSYTNSRLKYICTELRQHSKCVLVTVCSLCLIILVSVIIGVAASSNDERHPTGKEPLWMNNTMGLTFYPIPEDKTIVISYQPGKAVEIIKALDKITSEYMSTNQTADIFVSCNETYKPSDKVCHVTTVDFGDQCSRHNNYGYKFPQPCVFIQLNLPDNMVIEPITRNSSLWSKAEPYMKDHKDTANIPVTCAGSQPEDVDILNQSPIIDGKKERISYFPKYGLPSYIYRNRSLDIPFVKPAMMVLFTSLKDKKKVHITCTAWGQLYDLNKTPKTMLLQIRRKCLHIDIHIYLSVDSL
ncbi:hypothetical protein Btru_016873 [Bulinus truncatus]|nr:hypothetical protein Btru_016873 [Bulinus truncatus]